MDNKVMRPCDFGGRHIECVIATYLWRWAAPILVVIGTFGSLLSLAVLSRKKMAGTTTSVYLRALAVSDLLTLYLTIPRHVIDLWHYVDVITKQDATCGLFIWMDYTICPLSIFFMCAMTVDRALLIKRPFFHRRHCSQKTCVCVIALIVVVMVIINAHFLVDMKRVEHSVFVNETNVTLVYDVRCRSSFSWLNHYQSYIWQKVMVVCYVVLPSACIIVCNSLICRVLYKRRGIVSSNSEQLAKAREARSITVMLVCICAYFILSIIPISTHLAIKSVIFDTTNPTDMAKLRLSWAITGLIYFSNNALNFFFYTASGSLFRQEVKLMLQDTNHFILKRLCCTHSAETGKPPDSTQRTTVSMREDIYVVKCEVHVDKHLDTAD